MSAKKIPCPTCQADAACYFVSCIAPPILHYRCELCAATFEIRETEPNVKIDDLRATDFVILQMLKAAGGRLTITIPQPLTPDQQGALQNALLIPGVAHRQDGTELRLSLHHAERKASRHQRDPDAVTPDDLTNEISYGARISADRSQILTQAIDRLEATSALTLQAAARYRLELAQRTITPRAQA